MLKFAALLFNTIILFIYQLFFSDGVTISKNIPSSAKPESEFTVELTIHKGSIGGFAKLQQDLPEGFLATQDENNGASFTFSNHSVKFIWMSLPSDNDFTITYKVKVAAGISGDKVIVGKFSYISDNIKQVVDIAPSTITIENADAIATTDTLMATNTNDTEFSSVSCVRSIPTSASSSFKVELTINKGNSIGFAKLIETLPAGFTASADETQGGSFSFIDQKVKFIWVSMPSQPEFKISYYLSPTPSISGNQIIDGTFSYIEDDETKKIMISPSTLIIGGATTKRQAVTSTTSDAKNINKGTNTDNTTKALSATTIPSPQGKVTYRVQIAALHKAVDATLLAAKYHINTSITTEMAEGFTKYTAGSENEYKAARDVREDFRNKGVVGPFVTAYNKGKRITVQEALMITNQQWFK